MKSFACQVNRCERVQPAQPSSTLNELSVPFCSKSICGDSTKSNTVKTIDILWGIYRRLICEILMIRSLHLEPRPSSRKIKRIDVFYFIGKQVRHRRHIHWTERTPIPTHNIAFMCTWRRPTSSDVYASVRVKPSLTFQWTASITIIINALKCCVSGYGSSMNSSKPEMNAPMLVNVPEETEKKSRTTNAMKNKFSTATTPPGPTSVDRQLH